MFKIAQYTAAEKALARQVTALEELKNDPELKRELEFSAELDDLLAKYSFSRSKLHGFLNAQEAAIKAAEKAEKKPVGSKSKTPTGKVKLWTNPHTGEKIESARRDHNVLLGWTEQYGLKEVLSWATPL